MIDLIRMNFKQFASILLIFISFNKAYSQTKKVKKRIKIVTRNFGVNEYSDTVITTYNINGSIKEGYQGPKVIVAYLDSIVKISEVDYIRHDRNFLSNNSIIDVYKYNFGDSIIQYEISDLDTVNAYKSYLKNGKLFRRLSLDIGEYYQEINYSKYTKRREVAEVITKSCMRCDSDTIRIDFARKRNVYKTYKYNTYLKEWFVSEKIKRRENKHIVRHRFYDDYQRQYFRTKTTSEYNNLDMLMYEKVYDSHLKEIESETIYIYEYY